MFQVDHVKASALKQLEGSEQRIKATTERGKDVMSTMEVTSVNVQNLNGQIRNMYPQTKKTVRLAGKRLKSFGVSL